MTAFSTVHIVPRTLAPLRILFDLSGVDRNAEAAHRYAMELARSLSTAGETRVRIIGNSSGIRSFLRNRAPWRSGRLQFGPEAREFKADVIHLFGDLPPETPIDPARLFVTFDNIGSTRSDSKFKGHTKAQVICPSVSAMNIVASLQGIPTERISVVPPGARPAPTDGRFRTSRGNFFLLVGCRDAGGSFDALVRALATTPTLADTRIVAFGAPFSSDERQCIARAGMSGRVIAVSGDDDALAGYYDSALALVHPRLSDQWGYRVLDGMARGCPVACSRLGALPEIAGDAALYFDPADVNDIGTTLVHLAADAGLRNRLAEIGRARATDFSWSRSAERTLEFYGAKELSSF